MTRQAENVVSLRSHLMERLLTALFWLWLLSTIVGYFATLNYANQPHDLILLQRAQALAEHMKLGSGEERLDYQPLLPDGKEPGNPDRVVFTVSDSNGMKIAGNANLARPISYRKGRPGPLFSNSEREGEKTRMISLVYPGPPGGKLYQLHVSETTHQRRELVRGILGNIVIPQLLLILIAAAAVWYGLMEGLAPLERLRQEVAGRKRDDLNSLDATQAPEEVRPLIQLGKPPAMPGDSKRFDLCCGRVSGYCNDRSAFIPHFAKGGRGGDLRTVMCRPAVLKSPSVPLC